VCSHLQEAQQRWLRGDWGRGMQILWQILFLEE
jgi:hypothetical protein